MNMAVKIIRTKRDLPDWYKISNYEGCRELDAAGWYKAIAQRMGHLNFLETIGPAKSRKFKSLRSNLLELRKNPLYVPKNRNHLLILGGNDLLAIEKHKGDFSRFSFAISPYTLRKLYQTERFFKKSIRDKTRKYMDALYEGLEVPNKDEKWCLSKLDKPLFDILKIDGDYRPGYKNRAEIRTKDIVEIDFSVPDKILLEQFSVYLKLTRKNYPDIKKPYNFKRPNFLKWHTYGVLPYLDLKIWAIENEINIPYRVLTDAIFPDGVKDEEAIRKTTQKIATKIMSNSYLKALSKLIAEEGYN